MSDITSLLLVGVGGQGTILAAKILSQVALLQGMDVKMSEVHGMSQRGGSVVTYVKFGPEVHSPLVEQGEADYILAFEQLEALRWAHYLKPSGVLVVNEQKISPMPVITGAAGYPDNITASLASAGIKIVACDALNIARECGNTKAANVVLMGVLAKHSSIPLEDWQQAVTMKVPPKYLQLNQKAFQAGYESK